MTDQFSVHEAQICAVATCHCRLGNAPMLIMSTQIEAYCAYCGAGFKILGVEYALGETPYPKVTVGMRPDAMPQHLRMPARAQPS